jgi:hypothetical protein
VRKPFFRGYFQHFHVLENTFAFLHDQPCPGAGSDASSFYLRHLAPAVRAHGRRGSNISVTSPISLYHNRSFRRHDSSASSIACLNCHMRASPTGPSFQLCTLVGRESETKCLAKQSILAQSLIRPVHN